MEGYRRRRRSSFGAGLLKVVESVALCRTGETLDTGNTSVALIASCSRGVTKSEALLRGLTLGAAWTGATLLEGDDSDCE